MILDTATRTRESIAVMPLDQQNRPRHQPTRLVFLGIFCLWAKPRLPSDGASVVVDGPKNSDSSRDAVVVFDRSAAAGHAADVAGREPGDDFLRSRVRLGISRQGTIPLRLVGSLGVEMVGVFPEGAHQAAIIQEPASADEFRFDRSDPALGKGVAVGTVRRDPDGLDVGMLQNALPGIAELSVSVVDEGAAPDPLQPSILGSGLPGDLGHVGLVGVLGDAQDLDRSCLQVDPEEDIVGLRACRGLHLGGEEVRCYQDVRVLGDEGLPGGVGAADGRGRVALALEDRGDGARRDGQQEHGQDARDALLAPDRILGGQSTDDLFDGSLDARSAPSGPLDAQLSGLPQPLPALDGLGLGDGGDLGQSLPAHGCFGAGKAQPPAVREREAMALGQLLAQIRDLCPEIGDLGDEHLILPGSESGSDEAGEERQIVHGVGQALSLSWPHKRLAA